MASPLEGALAAKIGKAFASTFYAATVNHTTTGEPDPSTPWIPVTTTVAYPCKGMQDQFSAYDRANSLVQADDVKVIILAASLAVVPTPIDTVTIRGITYRVIKVATDPAMATHECQCRV